MSWLNWIEIWFAVGVGVPFFTWVNDVWKGRQLAIKDIRLGLVFLMLGPIVPVVLGIATLTDIFEETFETIRYWCIDFDRKVLIKSRERDNK